LAQHEAPSSVAPLEEIVEAPGADHVADDTVHAGALRNRHLGLGNRAVARDLDRAAAEEVQNAHAPGPALVVPADELLEGNAAGPGREHLPVRMPDGAELLPQARVAPQGPVLYQLADRCLVGGDVGHVPCPLWSAGSRP